MMRPALVSAWIATALFSGCGASTDPEALRAAHADVARLTKELEARDQEAKALRQAVEKFGDPEKLRARVGEVERARDKAQADLAVAEAVVKELRERVAADEAQASRPAPPAPTDPKIADIVEKCSPSVILVKTSYGAGAGFFLGPGGFIVTNYHVIAGARKIDVISFGSSPRERPAKAVAVDLANDLALLVLQSGEAVAGLELEADATPRVGDEVFTIGNPGMGDVVLAQSVSSGIISSMARQLEGATYLQTTTPINPGNSGGPLINRAGKVVGVVTAKGVGVENIGFAIPAACVRDLFAAKDGAFAVKSSLAEWEREKGFKRTLPPSAGIPVNGMLTQLYVDESLDLLVGLNLEGNGVLLVSLSKKEVVGSVFTGLHPTYLVPDRDPRIYWVSHQEEAHLSKVDVVDRKVVEQVKLDNKMFRIVAAPDRIWETGGMGLRTVPTKGGKVLQCDFRAAALAYDWKKSRLFVVDAHRTLFEAGPDSILPLIRQYQEAKTRGAKAKEVNQISDEIQRRFKLIARLPAPPGRGFASTLLMSEKGDRLYANHVVVELSNPPVVQGALPPAEHSRVGEVGIRTFLQRRPLLQLIQASSPDGRWVATGTHLFSATKFVIQKELPIPSEALDFSADSKTLYYFDFINRQIVPMAVE